MKLLVQFWGFGGKSISYGREYENSNGDYIREKFVNGSIFEVRDGCLKVKSFGRHSDGSGWALVEIACQLFIADVLWYSDSDIGIPKFAICPAEKWLEEKYKQVYDKEKRAIKKALKIVKGG